MRTASITAAILTHNEAQMLAGCLATLQWCDQIIVLDHHSTDDTVKQALAAGAVVSTSRSESFAQRREQLLAACRTDWILYIDADERVTPDLAEELQQTVTDGTVAVASFPRRNYFFGRQFSHGGWQGEAVTRLFRVSALEGWQGSIHESPIFEGIVKELQSPLWHFTHRNVADGLAKTARWTPMEAELLSQQSRSRVSVWTILRKGLGEAWRRGVMQAGWKDGQAGLVEVITQVINRMLVYMQVWERQQQPPFTTRYHSLEKEIAALWKKNR